MSIVLMSLHRHVTTQRKQRPPMRTSLFLSLTLALILSGTLIQPQRARADAYVPGTTLYLLDNQGGSDVTYTYSSQNGTVISPAGIFVIVTLDYMSGHMLDRHGNIVGYIL